MKQLLAHGRAVGSEIRRFALETKAWDSAPVAGRDQADIERLKLPSLERAKLSFSGHERNHLFQNLEGSKFNDVSGISGLDSPQDGRSFAVWDFDRDGWQDIALLNINTPVLSLYRNQQGFLNPDQGDRQMVAFKFVGGNQNAEPSSQYGPRDGYGATVTASLAERSLVQQHRCGEGLAAQNSSYMFFGIGDDATVKSARVLWPSGVDQTINNVPAGSLVTVFENASESSDGSGFEISRYLVEKKDLVAGSGKEDLENLPSLTALPSRSSTGLTMYTSLATWCPNCRKQIPQLKFLRENFTEAKLSIIGAPIDPGDSTEKLSAYIAKHEPPYDLPKKWGVSQMAILTDFVVENVGSDVLPATLIVGSNGQILKVFAGVPTVSELTRLMPN